ncbi:MAG: hypothetical protein AAGC85_14215 [Bacteroidota bacterium]
MLSNIQNQLKQILAKDTKEAIRLLRAQLSEESNRWNELILLERRYQDASLDRLRGIIEDEELQIRFNQITFGLLELVDMLGVDDLKAPKSLSTNKGSGHILYQIPAVMQLMEESSCRIRISFDKETLKEDLESEEGVNIQSIRVAEVMQVHLIDPGETPAFQIRTFSEAEQWIDEGAFTEWVFYVKPVKEGTHNLLLKVAVIELVRGKERKREIVLEETIRVEAKLDKSVVAEVGWSRGESLNVHGNWQYPISETLVGGKVHLDMMLEHGEKGGDLPAETGSDPSEFEQVMPSENWVPEPQIREPAAPKPARKKFQTSRLIYPFAAVLALLIAGNWLFQGGKKIPEGNNPINPPPPILHDDSTKVVPVDSIKIREITKDSLDSLKVDSTGEIMREAVKDESLE